MSILNCFSSRVVQELRLEDTQLSSTFLSSPIQVFTYSLPSLQSIQLVETDDLLVERCVEVSCSSVGTVHCIAFWFQLHMPPMACGSPCELLITTGPSLSSLTSGTSHWRQAAILLEEPLLIKKAGQLVKVLVSLSLSRGVDCKIVS